MLDIIQDSNLIQDMKIKVPHIGDQIKGKILLKKHANVFVDLDLLGTGMIYGESYHVASDILKKVKVGDEILVQITDLENEDGYIELEVREMDKEVVWENIKKKKEKGEIFKVKILQVNRGGLLTTVEGLAAFLPVSQLSFENYPRVEGSDKNKIFAELQKFINKEMDVKLIDVDAKNNKLILSEKEVNNEELEKLLASLKPGDLVKGSVSRVTDFGAFLRFLVSNREMEGLIHISELAWDLIEDPEEIIKVGDEVEVKILDISKGRISLSLKALKLDPWQELSKKYKKGDVIKGVVYKHSTHGAFVKIDKSIYGLCHSEELEPEEIMKQKLQLGKTYEFQILSFSPADHKLSLKLE